MDKTKQLESLAAALLLTAREHGTPNSITPRELHQLQGGPDPITTGQLMRTHNYALAVRLAQDGFQAVYQNRRFELTNLVDFPAPGEVTLTLRDKIDFNGPEALARRAQMWADIRSMESHTPQGRNPSATYRAWDQARTPDLPLGPVIRSTPNHTDPC